MCMFYNMLFYFLFFVTNHFLIKMCILNISYLFLLVWYIMEIKQIDNITFITNNVWNIVIVSKENELDLSC